MIEKLKFKKVLVSNRGEIAVRIIKTLRRMGIKSVAIYSDADIGSLHVEMADESYYVGQSEPESSYLAMDKIINIAKISGSDAIHPGYGFLAENHVFAAKVNAENIVFIGPSESSIKIMGDKIAAKKVATEVGINIVPGYVGNLKSINEALKVVRDIGFPVIIKAAAGGGGRGMRVVHNEDEMMVAYNSARYEALHSFKDGRLFIEKLITNPRHIEVQVIGDRYGNVIHLFERECSIQRYHQKIIEEAPSSSVEDSTRSKMYELSIALCKHVSYYSAGTVEFILDQSGNFYFLEVNTRIQVEHTVTEMITGLDIVELMVLIAEGAELAMKQSDVIKNGHAIECRICAEDPKRGFMSSSGRITEYIEPVKTEGIRVDTGVKIGSEISMFYDSIVAKLCVHDKERNIAIQKTKDALSCFIIRGIKTNTSFLEAIIGHERFINADVSTTFIAEEYPAGFYGATLTSEIIEAFIACGMHIFMMEQIRIKFEDEYLPYRDTISTRWVIVVDTAQFVVVIKRVANGYNIRQGSNRIYIRHSGYKLGDKLYTAIINDKKINVQVEKIRNGYALTRSGTRVNVFVRSLKVAELYTHMLERTDCDVENLIKSPMNGQILALRVKEGDRVVQGQVLVVLTAMKMENAIIAHNTGLIVKVYVKEGDSVLTDSVLIEMN